MQVSIPKYIPGYGIIHSDVFQQPGKKNVYIIGSNGSGKSRLGIYIEENIKAQGIKAIRIAAQKVLSIPPEMLIRSAEIVDSELQQNHNRLFTFNNTNGLQNHVTSITNDFNHVLIKLFSLKADRDADFVEQYQNGMNTVAPIPTPIDTINIIWREIFPNRRLIFRKNKIEVEICTAYGSMIYSANEMSDGERGALYLLAHAFTASPNSVIIYDEPESHLHKSLLNRVWNLLERYNTDKTIVVITHDLDLVSSRDNAYKIWVKEFHGGHSWEWELIDNQSGIPDSLYLELLGSKKKILFVEGVENGDDQKLFQEIYKEYYVVPCDSCDRVIYMVKALSNDSFWRVYKSAAVIVKGIIDRDKRSDSDILYLKDKNIEVLKVAELENLLCLPDVLKILALNQGINDFPSLVLTIEERLRAFLSNHLMYEAFNDLKIELSSKLKAINKKKVTDFVEAYKTNFKEIDVSARLQELRSKHSDILLENNIETILKNFGNKGIIAEVGKCMGVSDYKSLVMRLLNAKTSTSEDLLNALRSNLPSI